MGSDPWLVPVAAGWNAGNLLLREKAERQFMEGGKVERDMLRVGGSSVVIPILGIFALQLSVVESREYCPAWGQEAE